MHTTFLVNSYSSNNCNILYPSTIEFLPVVLKKPIDSWKIFNLVKLRLLNLLTCWDNDNTNGIDYNNKIIFEKQICKSQLATVIIFYGVINRMRHLILNILCLKYIRDIIAIILIKYLLLFLVIFPFLYQIHLTSHSVQTLFSI